MKKHYISVLLNCCLLIGSLSANDDGNKGVGPEFLSECQNTNRCSIQGEVLFWNTSEDNIAFAEKTFIDVVSTGESQAIQESDRQIGLNFNWKPGVRVNVILLFPTRNWDFDFNWTHLVTHASKSVSAPDLSVSEGKGETAASGTILTPTWFESDGSDNPISLTPVNKINAYLHLSFNNYEATLGQTTNLSPWFNLHLFCGPKYTRIAQRYQFSYTRFELPSGGVTGAGTGEQTIKTFFNGFGLQGGLQGNWILGSGFSVYSSLSAGLLYGWTHTWDEEISQVETSDTHSLFSETEVNKYNLCVTRANMDLAIGVEWKHCFPKNYELAFKAGYEFHNYFDQNFLRFPISDDPARGNLAFNGATFGAKFDF